MIDLGYWIYIRLGLARRGPVQKLVIHTELDSAEVSTELDSAEVSTELDNI